MTDSSFAIDLWDGILEDQKRSGRCWIYASLVPLRLKTGIRFSTNYIFYFDQLEKSRAFLNRMRKLRDVPLHDEALSELLREPVSSVGQWCYFAALVEQYGLVPRSVMPDTEATEDGTIKALALRQLREGEPVVIGCDVQHCSKRKDGLLDLALGNGLPQLSKAEAIAFREINACHVMCIDGMTSDGRWRVQDSHGPETGTDGHYTMTDAWFDAYVLSAVVKKEYLPQVLRDALKNPTPPRWTAPASWASSTGISCTPSRSR